MPTPSLLQRLKERKLGKWALAYLAGAFVVFQAVEVMAEPWGISPGLQRAVHILLLFGLLVTLILAWYHGEKGHQRVGGMEFLLLALLVVMAGGALMSIRTQTESPSPRRSQGGDNGSPSILVLSCRNISPDPADAYLADGLHEALLHRLTAISGVRTLGHETARWYRENPASSVTIAKERGLDFIGECSVRKTPGQDRILIGFQLLDAEGAGVWSEEYDREFNAENLFDIQSSVALRVAGSLEAGLSPEEEYELESHPTESTQALVHYLRGKAFMRRPPTPENLWQAEDLFKQTVSVDPGFSVAWATLSECHSRLYWYFADRSPQRLILALEAASEAIRIDPDSPDGKRALGIYFYYGHRDYERALELFQEASSDRVTSLDHYWLAALNRRRGEYEVAKGHFLNALAEDPGWAAIYHQLGVTTLWMRDYSASEQFYEEAVSRAPETMEFIHKARLYITWIGDRPKALRELRRAGSTPPVGALLDRQVSGRQALFRILFPDPHRAEELVRGARSELDPATYFLTLAELLGRTDREEQASAHFDSARVVLEENLRDRPDDPTYYSDLGIAYAGLGFVGEAEAAVGRAAQLLPLSKDPNDGLEIVAATAEAMALIGNQSHTIDGLGTLLSRPGWLSGHWLILDPIWDPLRDHPRFQALLEKYAADVERN